MRTLMWMLAAGVFAGAVYAQMEGDEADLEAEIKAEVEEYFEAIDSNKDDKLDKAEIKALVKEQSGVEDESDFNYIQAYGSWLLDFLAADANDDNLVTREEMASLLRTQYSEDGKPALSKSDIKTLEKEYYTAAAKAMIKQLDTDNDGAISAKEAEVMGDAEGFAEVDLNKDGKVTEDELVKAIHGDTVEFYEVPEGVTVGKVTEDGDTELEITEAVQEAFSEADADGDGKVSKAEMKKRANGRDNTAFWWGLYISFLSMDTDDNGTVTIQEFARFVKDEEEGVKHKIFPGDKEKALDEIWGDLDADKDGKVSKEEFGKHFPDTSEYDDFDADGDGNVTRDEFWDGLFPNLAATYEYVDKKDSDEPAADDVDDVDPWALYKVVGRTWTHKSTTIVQGMDPIISYAKYGVLEVTDKAAKVQMTMMDKDKKETFSQEIEISFTNVDEQNGEEVEESDETIKVEAGEFECTKVVMDSMTSWISKRYAGLIVKYASTMNGVETSMELVEFKEGE